MPSYKVLRNLKHNGQKYGKGEKVEMSKEEAVKTDGAVDLGDDAPEKVEAPEIAPRQTEAPRRK